MSVKHTEKTENKKLPTEVSRKDEFSTSSKLTPVLDVFFPDTIARKHTDKLFARIL